MDPAAAALAATGERTVPGLPDEEYWFARHEAAYRWISDRPWLEGGLEDGVEVGIADRPVERHVLVDAGAGEGYGAAMLARASGEPVVALEYDAAACAHLRATHPGVRVVMANLASLPLPDRGADAIVSCQVIEHLWDLAGFLRECNRSLRVGGFLVLTTPNRLTFSPGLPRGSKPLNPFHVEEFDAEQLDTLASEAGFPHVEIRGVHHGDRIAAWESRHGDLVHAQIHAGLSGTWPPGLRDMVATVTARDFAIDPRPLPPGDPRLRSAQDLLVVARSGS